MISLDTPIENVQKISRKIIPALKHLDIHTIRDLLFHFPTRYEDFSNQKMIRDIAPNETVTVRGIIEKISSIRTARKKMFLTEAEIGDETGKIKAVWFNQPFLTRNLRLGNTVSVSGKVVLGPRGVYLQNPAYEKIIYQNPSSNRKSDFDTLHTGGLVPIYPETEGISSRWLRYLIKSFIELRKTILDPIPAEIREKYQLPEIGTALEEIHFPETINKATWAKRRFAFEQLLLIQLRALKERSLLKQRRAPAIPINLSLIKKFVSSVPFSLTNAQRRSIWEIIQDLAKHQPMNRLLEGDVGSGKTVVAAASALLVAQAGYQTAFMAPTEILALQHYETLSKLLEPFEISIGLLTGSEKLAEKNSEIFVGTHALIQKNISFENLGLVIIDEQHRFGVEQRSALIKNHAARITNQKDNFEIPHFLSMTATPIPRTLALTIYGDLDLSILDEMPQARKEIITKVVEPRDREKSYQLIKEEVKKGRQVFVVCPRIELKNENRKSEIPQQKLLLAETKAVKDEYKKLSEIIFSDLRVAMLHGKMKPKEKDAVMKKFKNGEFDILVSTSVIEVGVDVPNATIMMIEGAERFGLAQLHQFRGRVGRGGEQSFCLLFSTQDGMATRRLNALVETKNGFELAEIDMKLRGPGDIFGNRQWGIPDVAMAALTDASLVREVRKEAIDIIKKSPDLTNYPPLRERLNEFKESVHWE